MLKVSAASDGFCSLIGSRAPVKSHIGREWRWRGAMRCFMNSFTTIGAITSSSWSLDNLFQTKARPSQ